MLVQDILKNCGSISDTLESAVFVPSALLGVVKILLPRIYWKNMKSITDSIAHDWSDITTARSRKIMEKSSLIGRAGFVFLLGGSIFISLLAIAHKAALNIRMTSGNSTVLNVALGPGCWRANVPMNIYVVFVVQTIQLGIMQLCVSGSDACYYQIISHLSGQFDILKFNFGELTDSCVEKPPRFGEFVKRHNHLLALCSYVEETFSFVVLCHLMTNLCFISSAHVPVIIVLTTWDENEELGNLVIFGFTTLFLYGQIFLFCFAGEVLTTQTETLFHSIYSYPWYQLPVVESKKVLFILVKTRYPLYFTACRFYRLNLENFKNIVKFTATLFSFLRLSLQK